MATAAEVVNKSLSLILVQPSEAPIEAAEAQTALESLNDMMEEWAAGGLNTGYTVVSNLGDTITVPNGVLSAMKYNLALALAPEFGAQPSQLLFERAEKALRSVRRLLVSVGESVFPSTLPIGSGNECDTYSHFYGDEGAAIDTENDQYIATESGTEA